jgi:phenylacetate-coenzyme A ligase PaaK-like adenylate-forming protein
MAEAQLMDRVAEKRETARTSYESTRLEHLMEMRKRIPGHLEGLSWSKERLHEERTARLRALIEIARKRSTWHRERLVHLDIDALDADDLTNISVMTKNDLMTHFDQIVTDRQVSLDMVETHLSGLKSDAYLCDRYHAIASGGSSGQRGVFVYDWESWVDAFLSCLRYSIRARLQNPELSARPMRLAGVTAEHATHMSSALQQTFTDPTSTIAIRIPITMPLARIVANLNEANPDILIAYGSILPELAHEARAGRLHIAPKSICSVSEPLLPEIRALAKETWLVPVMNWWASSEGGGMGVSCGRSPGMHLSDDLLIIEPVDADGRPVPPGVRSDKIYLTNLYNPSLPLIRFEITDQITLIPDDSPCPCGSTHQRVEDVQGRLDDTFVYSEMVSVHPHIFRSRLGRNRNIVEYQVRQTERGAEIAIRCRGDVGLFRLQSEITGDLSRLGLHQPEITILLVDHLERQATGKLKRFVPLSPMKNRL